MKKCIVFILALLLTGCRSQETFETLGSISEPESSPQEVFLELPEDVAEPSAVSPENGKLYLCDGYYLTVQTLPGGDVERTLRTVTGYGRKDLTVLESVREHTRCLECIWTAAGDQELQVGRTCILDDGAYHYAVTAMAGESRSGELREQWERIFRSCRLVSSLEDFSTGS